MLKSISKAINVVTLGHVDRKKKVQTGPSIINDVIGEFQSQVEKLHKGIALSETSVKENNQRIEELNKDNANHELHINKARNVAGKIAELIS